MENALRLPKLEFNPNFWGKETRQIAMIWVMIFTMLTGMIVVYAQNENVPATGFEQFDAMYHMHMTEKDSPLLEDLTNPVNDLVFFLIKLQMRILGSFLLLLLVTTIAFAVWYAAKPDFAEEVSEVKMRMANGEKIPFDEPGDFIKQFCPDIKANSGISDSYEYETPTIGLLMRDHLLKFVLLFAIAIALSTNVITTFVVKAGYALASGAEYYTTTTDFVGIVNTITTAGKDFKPKYNTLTTEGRNKQKTFNAMYTALKKVDSRNRTQDYLDSLGTSVNTKVQELGGGQLTYEMSNFTAAADIVNYETEPDVSPTKVVARMPVSDFIAGAEGFMYLTVFQYETPEGGETNGRYQTITYRNSWNMGSGSYPTSMDIHKDFVQELASGYKFVQQGSDTSQAHIKTTNGESIRVTALITTTDTTLKVNLSNIAAKVAEIGDTDSLKSIEITGLSTYVTLTNGTDTKRLMNPIIWTAR